MVLAMANINCGFRRGNMSTTLKNRPNMASVADLLEQALAEPGVPESSLTREEMDAAKAAIEDLSTYVSVPGATPSTPPSIVKMSTWR
jgi:hypothetical protein